MKNPTLTKHLIKRQLHLTILHLDKPITVLFLGCFTLLRLHIELYVTGLDPINLCLVHILAVTVLDDIALRRPFFTDRGIIKAGLVQETVKDILIDDRHGG